MQKIKNCLFLLFQHFLTNNIRKSTSRYLWVSVKNRFVFLELPSIPIFYNTNGTVINNLTAPHTIKAALKVKCEVLGGKQKLKYRKSFVCSIYQYTKSTTRLMKTNFCFFFVVCMCFNVHRNNKEFLLPLILTMRRHCCTYVTFSYFYAFSWAT